MVTYLSYYEEPILRDDLSKSEFAEDTTLAASDLTEGKIKDNTCVICRKNAGEKYN